MRSPQLVETDGIPTIPPLTHYGQGSSTPHKTTAAPRPPGANQDEPRSRRQAPVTFPGEGAAISTQHAVQSQNQMETEMTVPAPERAHDTDPAGSADELLRQNPGPDVTQQLLRHALTRGLSPRAFGLYAAALAGLESRQRISLDQLAALFDHTPHEARHLVAELTAAGLLSKRKVVVDHYVTVKRRTPKVRTRYDLVVAA